MSKYTLLSEKSGKVNLFLGAYRRVHWYTIWFLRKGKHHTHRGIRQLLDKTIRHPALEHRRQIATLKGLLSSIYGLSNTNANTKRTDIILVLRDGGYYPKSSAFIRLIAPLSLPQVQSNYLITIHDQTIAPDDIVPGAICIIQRTVFDSLDQAKQILAAIDKKRATLIIDNDDAFSLLDSSHSEHSMLGEKGDALELLAEHADELWVSTDHLAKLNPHYEQKTVVMFNTVDERLWQRDARSEPQGAIKMVYMGTATHDADFKMILPALDEVYKKYPGSFELSIIGVSQEALPERPWLVRLYQPRGHAIYPRFVKWFTQQGPFDVGLCPLVKSPFNDAKSDIKCLDYLAAGIHPVASNVPAYHTPGLEKHITITDNTTDKWSTTIQAIVSDPAAFRKYKHTKQRHASEYIQDERSTPVIATKMLERLTTYSRR